MDVVVREGAHLSLLFQSRGVANSKLGSDHAPRIYGRRRVPQAWWLSWRPVEVPKSPPHLAVGGNNASPWTKRTAKFRQSILPYEGEQLFPGDRTAPREAAALLLIGMNVAHEHEREFNEWYNTQHIAALSAVPGGGCAPAANAASAIRSAMSRSRSTTQLRPRWCAQPNGPKRRTPHRPSACGRFSRHLRIECRRYTRT